MSAQKNAAKSAPAQNVNPLASLLPEKTAKKQKVRCPVVSVFDVVVYRRSDLFHIAYVEGEHLGTEKRIFVSDEGKAPDNALFGGVAHKQDPSELFASLLEAGYKLA